jgi:TrmH family RNA methyltransferase
MPQRITSAANPLVKTLKGLHAKKGRAEAGLFLAEGARIAAEAAEAGLWPEIAAVSEAALTRAPVRALTEDAEARGARVILVGEALLAKIAKRDNPQTMIGAYRHNARALETLDGDLFIALEGVRDPGNLGTILRTADCAGASGVILVDQTCDPFSVEAVRASMGSIFSMPFARASFDAFDAWRCGRGLHLIGASLNGAWGDNDFDAARPHVLLMGNEQSGLPEAIEARCDALVRIPMRGKADSLNLAAATAVLVYDVWRRRGYDGA